MKDTKPSAKSSKQRGPHLRKVPAHTEEDAHNEEPELTDTIFIRNIARFDTTQESLKEYMEKNFGPTVYCLICKDKETGESKGTAFVKFKSAETAEECLEQFEDPEHQTKFFLDGRNIFVLPALSRDKISEVKRAVAPKEVSGNSEEVGTKKTKKPRHNRAKPLTESVDDSVSSNPKSHVNRSNGTAKNSSSMQKKKDKMKKTDKNKNRQQPKLRKNISPGGARVKKVKDKSKNKFAKKVNQKPRGRHSR